MLIQGTFVVEITGITGGAYPPALLQLVADNLHSHWHVLSGNRTRPLWTRYYVDNTVLLKGASAQRERADALIQKGGSNLSESELSELAAISREADRLILADVQSFKHPVDVVLRRGGVLQAFVHIAHPRWDLVRVSRALNPKLSLLLVADRNVMEDAYARDEEFRRLRTEYPQYYCATVERALEQQNDWVRVVKDLPGTLLFERTSYEPQALAAQLSEFIIRHGDMANLRTLKRASCFISYSSKDQSFCERLNLDLRSADVSTSFFPEQPYRAGAPLWEEIERSLRANAHVVVIASRHSLVSAAVLKEIDLAVTAGRDRGRRVLKYATIDGYIFDEWNREADVSALDHIVADFRGWLADESVYQRNVAKLLAGLRE